MIAASSTDMPVSLRSVLLDVFGSDIDGVRIVEYSWINALHGWPLAVTRRNRIYLRYSAAEFFANPGLVMHEYHHVLNQWNTGDLTVTRYLLQCLRRGYWNNPYEVEARAFAAQQAARVRPDSR
jgi:hypothetical protein